ncbi:MAG TPA: hypothetical protein VMT18_13730, partial [Planctomycetota bacterium]|nr:hypothetical protein [Planctomycetota bacterium]
LERSGLSTAAFAHERGVAAWKLYAGQRRRRRRRLVARSADGAEVGAAPAFVPVQLTAAPPSGSMVEVELHGGRLLRVPVDFEESSLLRLVRALESC